MSRPLAGVLSFLGPLYVEELDGAQVVAMPPNAVEGSASLLLYSLAELAYTCAAAPGDAGELGAELVLQGLTFPDGVLRLWLGEVRGRQLELDVRVHPDGRVRVSSGRSPGEILDWLKHLTGEVPVTGRS